MFIQEKAGGAFLKISRLGVLKVSPVDATGYWTNAGQPPTFLHQHISITIYKLNSEADENWSFLSQQH